MKMDFNEFLREFIAFFDFFLYDITAFFQGLMGGIY